MLSFWTHYLEFFLFYSFDHMFQLDSNSSGQEGLVVSYVAEKSEVNFALDENDYW